MSVELAAKITNLIAEAKAVQSSARPMSAPLYENVLNHLMGAENHALLIAEREADADRATTEALQPAVQELDPDQLTPD